MSEKIGPRVSVCITAYNHQSFIAQAIDSVLAQETPFAVEILVGEDDSDDGTREIVRRYAERYPDQVRVFLNDRSAASRVDGIPTGHANSDRLLRMATGEYIALLDGDDYWTDSSKLADQVAILDDRPDLSMCFTDIALEYHSGERGPHQSNRSKTKTEFSAGDLLKNFCLTKSTVVFRRRLMPQYPSWFYDVPVGDVPIAVFITQHGDAYFLNHPTIAYRVHDGGWWSKLERADQLEKGILIRKRMMPHLPVELKAIGRDYIFERLYNIVKHGVDENQSKLAWRSIGRMWAFALRHPSVLSGRKEIRWLLLSVKLGLSS